MPKAVPGHVAKEQDSREARPPGLVPLGREAPWKEQQLCIGKVQLLLARHVSVSLSVKWASKVPTSGLM